MTRWSKVSLLLAVLAIGAFFAAKAWIRRIDETERWILLESASPNRSHIATVWAEAPWMSYDEYVVVRGIDDKSQQLPIATLEDPRLLVRWASNQDLEIGVPVKSEPVLDVTEKDGIRFRMVPYPNQPAIHDKWKELLHRDPYPVSEMIDFERSPDFIDALIRSATYRLPAANVAYESSETIDAYGNRTCKLGFGIDGGRAAATINFALQAQIQRIQQRDFVSFSLVVGILDVRDSNLSRLSVTGAQFVGSGFATGMAEAMSFANGPKAGDEFTIYLQRQRDMEQFLAALSHHAFALAFLWDLPDTVVVSEINGSPSSEQLALFFRCVGDAAPSHLEGEEFKPFYHSLPKELGG